MIRTNAKNTIAGIMVSYTIFTSPSNLFYFHLLGIVPPPRQRVFPILDRLQYLPSSPISPKWYLFPKTAIHFSRYRRATRAPGLSRMFAPFPAGACRSFDCPHFTTFPPYSQILLLLYRYYIYVIWASPIL